MSNCKNKVCTILVSSVGTEEAHFGGDRSRSERHRDPVSVRQRSGGDHGAAERALPREETALGAGAALSVCAGPGWSPDGGHLQVGHRQNQERGLVMVLSVSYGAHNNIVKTLLITKLHPEV